MRIQASNKFDPVCRLVCRRSFTETAGAVFFARGQQTQLFQAVTSQGMTTPEMIENNQQRLDLISELAAQPPPFMLFMAILLWL